MALTDEQLREHVAELRTLGSMFALVIADQLRTIHMSPEAQNQSVLIQFRLKKTTCTLQPLRNMYLRATRMRDIGHLLDEEERKNRGVYFSEGPPTNHRRDEIVNIENLRLWFWNDVRTYLTFGHNYSYAHKEGRRIRRLTGVICDFLSQTDFFFLKGCRGIYTTVWETALAIELIELLRLQHVAANTSWLSNAGHIVDFSIWGCELVDEIESRHADLMKDCLSNISPSFQRLKKHVDSNIEATRNVYRSMI